MESRAHEPALTSGGTDGRRSAGRRIPTAGHPARRNPSAPTGTHLKTFIRGFAVRGVFWRQCLDWALLNVPFYLQPILLTFSTVFFYFFAAPERRAIISNLTAVLPGSSRIANHFRAFRTLLNFAWTISEASNYKLKKAEYDYEIVGADLLAQLGAAKGAVVVTAHMGNYDLGAALFAQKFDREIRMVRAPEPDELTERHLAASLQQSGAGAVKVNYNVAGSLLSFDLLSAIRSGEIVAIQGDRVNPGVASVDAQLFGRPVQIPSGPFTLALVAQVPIFPLFIVRRGFRRYRIIVREPILIVRTRARDEDIAVAVATWCTVLETVVAEYWHQWFALTPMFRQSDAAA